MKIADFSIGIKKTVQNELLYNNLLVLYTIVDTKNEIIYHHQGIAQYKIMLKISKYSKF